MTERGTAGQRQATPIGLDPFTVPAATHTLAAAPTRARVVVEGTVGSSGTAAWAGGPVAEATLVDGTDLITLVFFGRREVAGVHAGMRLVAAGAVVNHHGRRVVMNPQLWLTPASPASAPAPAARAHRGVNPPVPALTAAF
jgi:hypothetical protein